jgi:hypothetical protein
MIAETRSGGYFFDCQSSAGWVLFSISKTDMAEIKNTSVEEIEALNQKNVQELIGSSSRVSEIAELLK